MDTKHSTTGSLSLPSKKRRLEAPSRSQAKDDLEEESESQYLTALMLSSLTQASPKVTTSQLQSSSSSDGSSSQRFQVDSGFLQPSTSTSLLSTSDTSLLRQLVLQQHQIGVTQKTILSVCDRISQVIDNIVLPRLMSLAKISSQPSDTTKSVSPTPSPLLLSNMENGTSVLIPPLTSTHNLTRTVTSSEMKLSNDLSQVPLKTSTSQSGLDTAQSLPVYRLSQTQRLIPLNPVHTPLTSRILGPNRNIVPVSATPSLKLTTDKAQAQVCSHLQSQEDSTTVHGMDL